MPTPDLAALIAQRQTTRLIQIHFPNEDGPDSAFLINGLHASEGLSKDFVFTLEVINDDGYIQAKRVLGKLVTVELERSTGEPRYFNGYVSSFKNLRSDGGYAFYEMTLQPWMAFLRKRQDQYIFHNQTLKATVAEIFADYPEADYSFQLTQSYPTETFRVQYEESDHNYIHRRIEERGWVYWYEHSKDGHRLIISDDTTLADPIDGAEQIRFHDDSSV